MDAVQATVTDVCVEDVECTDVGALGGVVSDGGGVDFAVTTAVRADRATVLPFELDAVTTTRSRWPASAVVTTYFADVALAIAVQLVPELVQRLQLYAYFVGEPLQVPRVAESVAPTTGLPLMVGSAVFVGAVVAAPAPVTTTAASANIATTIPKRDGFKMRLLL